MLAANKRALAAYSTYLGTLSMIVIGMLGVWWGKQGLYERFTGPTESCATSGPARQR